MATIDEVLSKLNKVESKGERAWMACCPAHADKTGSLSVSEGDNGRVLLHCFAHCPTDSVVAAMGLRLSDLMGESKAAPSGSRAPALAPAPQVAPAEKKKSKPFSLAGLKPGHIWKLHKRDYAFVEWYDYTDAQGAILYRVLRFKDIESHSKTFIQCVPTESGLWEFGRESHGVKAVLYKLPEVTKAAKEKDIILVVEGEKDVATARRMGFTATTCLQGAGKWDAAYADALIGSAHVVVIADKDKDEKTAKAENPDAMEWWQGQRHATDIADSLAARGIHHTVLTLPETDGFHVKDISEWADVAGKEEDYASGRYRALLTEIFADAKPWPSDLYRRPLREEPSASKRVKPRGKGAAQDALQPQPSGASIQNAAGGMPTPPLSENSVSSSPSTPHMEGVKNVGGEGGADDEECSVSYLRSRLIEAMTDKDASGLQKKRLMCSAVCEWLGKRGKFFYDLEDKGHGTAMWFDAVEKKLHRIKQDYFQSWLSRATAFSREFKDYKMFISAVQDESLIGEATQGIRPKRYWHREGDRIYLSNGEGRMARITAEDVTMVDNGTDGIVFEQGFILTPWELLPEAEARDPFESCGVFSGISTVDGRGLMLVRLWFSGMFGVTGWKPLLVLSGDVGSGKTRVAVAMFQLLGVIQRVTAIDAIGNVKDFWASVDKGGLFCLDNADHHITWLPDALSVISTGGTFEKKKLYTDTETVTQEARCWAVVTSANPSFAADAGLSDRLITVNLQRVERDTAESELTHEIEANRFAAMTWLCTVMRKALADKEPVPKGMNRRHPDWSNWVYKIGKAAGMAEKAETAIRENEGFKALFSVSNDSFGKFVLAAMKNQKGEFTGSADDLSKLLSEKCEGFSSDMWTTAKIGKAMARLSVSLKSLFKFEKLNHSGRAVYKLHPYASPLDDLPTLEQPLLGVVGDVGAISTKSPDNSNLHDFYHSNPHIPHIPPHNKLEGERERIEGPSDPDGDWNEWEVGG